MSRPNDTQRMQPPDATNSSATPEKTDPIPAPAKPQRVITQPLPIPITGAPAPEVRVVDRRNATDPDIDPLLKAFDRTPVPPAPQPDARASSDGGDFVAHYAVTKPAASNARRSTDPRIVVQRELRQLISEPSPEGAVVAPCEVSTEVPLGRQLRRRRAALIAACAIAAAVILLAAAVATRTATPVAPVAATSSALPQASVSPPVASALTAVPAPSASVAPAQPSAVTPTPPASVAPARPTARPVQAPKPQKPDDELEYVLPR